MTRLTMLLPLLLPLTAVADPGDDLIIRPVAARAVVQVTSIEVETIEGDEGPQTQVRLTGEGPITSEDPRLNGILYADAVILTDADGHGISRDEFEIFDPATGQRLVKGSAWGIHADPAPIHGQAVARLRDGSRFYAESTVTVPPPGSLDPIVIEYGFHADRAVILEGMPPLDLTW